MVHFLLAHLSPQVFEAVMLFCFGCAWPVSIYRSYRAGRNEGKSISFLYVILFGYLNGIIFQGMEMPIRKNYVFFLFLLNTILVTIDIMIYYRNHFAHAKTNVLN